MFSDNDMKAIEKIPETYTSRVIEIFNTTLKVLGIRIDFVDDDEKVKVLDNWDLKTHKLNGAIFVCTDYEFYLIESVDRMRSAILDKYPVMTKRQLNEALHEMIENNSCLSEGMTNDLYKLIESYNMEELKEVQESIGEEVNKMEGISDDFMNKPEELKEEVKEEPVKKTRVRKKKVEAEVKEEKPKKRVTRKKAVKA